MCGRLMARKTYGLSGGSFLFELFQLEHDELARLHTEAELFQVVLGELRLNHLPKCGEALSLELLEAVRQVQLSQPARQGHRRWRRRRSIGRCDRRLELLGLLRVQAELAEVVRRQLGLQHLGQCVEALRSKLLDRAYIYQTGSHRPHRRQLGTTGAASHATEGARGDRWPGERWAAGQERCCAAWVVALTWDPGALAPLRHWHVVALRWYTYDRRAQQQGCDEKEPHRRCLRLCLCGFSCPGASLRGVGELSHPLARQLAPARRLPEDAG
jgi:hypothetical protein